MRHEEATAGWEAATLLSTEFRARNHAALEHVDFAIGHGLSGVPLSGSRLRQHGLTPTSREDQSGKPALERIDWVVSTLSLSIVLQLHPPLFVKVWLDHYSLIFKQYMNFAK